MNYRIEKRIELQAPISRVWSTLTDYREFGEWFKVKLKHRSWWGRSRETRLLIPALSSTNEKSSFRKWT